ANYPTKQAPMKDVEQLRIGTVTVQRGRTRDIYLKISETYTRDDITMPVRVIRAKNRAGFVRQCGCSR
ncbi:MAG: hypothetical protein LR015_03120, partial [Verrucomicrobia bacterium]|nr:hypothetical protein [Verrucomicrobiota bacterium]